MVESMSVPPWVEHLLSTTFFLPCEIHTKHRYECNKYCLDCRDEAFCNHCIPLSHKDHNVIQIRRSSYHECVKAVEIENFFDISGVQTFVINSAKVIYLNRRMRNEPLAQAKIPPSNFGKKNTQCEICQRNLLDPFCFCSLQCKLAWIRNYESERIVLSAKKDEEMPRTFQSGISSRPQPTLPSSSNSRKRKGIPRRAPFF